VDSERRNTVTSELEQKGYLQSVEKRARERLANEDQRREQGAELTIEEVAAYTRGPDFRLSNAVANILREDREAEKAPARKQAEAKARREAEFQAQYLAQQRHELGEGLEKEAATINRMLTEYVSVSRRHIEARDKAELTTDEGRNVEDLLDEWFASRFAGSIPSVRPPSIGEQDITRIGQPDLPLFQLDPLASPGGGNDMDGAA
jgi:hypothetical protein